ncbi:hypothetical protein FHW88_000461 [Mucilaginibacter sp. SG538B]|uniref:hypothetical protein n=1 Tax=Mucilaginibacter sp. SG538B TaxID=2587021 RepID=UPI00159DE345|nr:hypothetical protein [Mucilaginibacter sp. SG538B]NVM62185.1 hypothetical protein [Mucilaginibacter sp. SG538B]
MDGSLFPGFRISCTIMGKADERFKTNNMTNTGNDPDYVVKIASPASDIDGNSLGIDGQFDIFSVHLPGHDNSFILKFNGTSFTSVNIPDAPLQITTNYNSTLSSISGFSVIDEKSVQYIFGSDGTTASTNQYVEMSSNLIDPTGWMLRQIILPGGITSLISIITK